MSKNRLERILLVSYSMRRASYVIRGIAGAYVVYLMFQLFSESADAVGELTPLMIAAGVLMTLAGIYFVIGAVYGFVKGIYAENDPERISSGSQEEDKEDTAETGDS
jgi:hypothetical protein